MPLSRLTFGSQGVIQLGKQRRDPACRLVSEGGFARTWAGVKVLAVEPVWEIKKGAGFLPPSLWLCACWLSYFRNLRETKPTPPKPSPKSMSVNPPSGTTCMYTS